MHISIANFSQMVTDRTNTAIVNKSYKVLTLAYLYLTLTHSKCQGQAHAHFDYGILAKGDRLSNIDIGNK